MKIRLTILTAMMLCMTTISSTAQDDPWWKNLFKKETVEEIEDDKTEENNQKIVITSEATIDTIPVIIPITHKPGLVTINTPYSLDTLNASLIENPEPTKGFRIQIFFGNLHEAKGQRSNYMGSFRKDKCYLVQNVPNYAVRVGDYRSELEAHKKLQELKLRYPSAYIVPDEIEFPQLADGEN